MSGFEVPLGAFELLLPGICFGILFAGVLQFLYMYTRTKESLYLSMVFFGGFASIFVLSEVFVLTLGGWFNMPDTAVKFHRSEQLAGAYFLFAVPFMLSCLLTLNSRWQKINRFVSYAGLAFAVVVTIAAFANPSLFISQTEHGPMWAKIASDHGRGLEGPLYRLRDTLLGIVIIYTFIVLVIDLIWNRKFGYLVLPIVGIISGIVGAANDTVFVNSHYNFILDGILFSRFSLGITIFIVLCMASSSRYSVEKAKEVEEAQIKAKESAERSQRQTDFIKNVLQTSTASILSSVSEMSATIARFTQNSGHQAAATEEVTASIEEISAGANHVSTSAQNQDSSLSALVSTMSGYVQQLNDTGRVVTETLTITERVGESAHAGDQSIRVMDESMRRIGESSKKMDGIIQIINDISDRINLLSLNAAIEAARAGEAGRGFAVVADEISKLADATASSIKEIDQLIRANDREIETGTSNINAAVDAVGSIISEVGNISEKINRISELMSLQLSSNADLHSGAERVRNQSNEIMSAMMEQRNDTTEISRTIGQINDIAQENTVKISDMAESSKTLVGMVEELNRKVLLHQG